MLAPFDGRLPYGMGVARLTDLPAEWSKQREICSAFHPTDGRSIHGSLCSPAIRSAATADQGISLTNRHGRTRDLIISHLQWIVAQHLLKRG
jgi:hypothetical protein